MFFLCRLLMVGSQHCATKMLFPPLTNLHTGLRISARTLEECQGMDDGALSGSMYLIRIVFRLIILPSLTHDYEFIH